MPNRSLLATQWLSKMFRTCKKHDTHADRPLASPRPYILQWGAMSAVSYRISRCAYAASPVQWGRLLWPALSQRRLAALQHHASVDTEQEQG